MSATQTQATDGAGTLDAEFVSVVIPMRNEATHIEACLRSLARQEFPRGRLEVLLVDGASDDGSRAIAERVAAAAGLPLTVIDNPGRTAARGLNLGIARARGDVIVRLDAHAEAGPRFLAEALASLRAGAADIAGGPIESVGRGPVGEAIAAALSSPFGVGDAAFRYSQVEQETDTVAFPAYRRDVFERAGLFAEDIDGGEDDEFHLRLAGLGMRLLLTPRIRSVYHTRDSLLDLWRQYFRYGHAKVAVLARHPTRIRARQLVPPGFVGALAALGVLAALFRGPFVVALGVLAGAYAAASLVASASLAARRGPRLLPLLPLAFACLHFAYGLGFLAALARGGYRRRPAPVRKLGTRT